MDKTVQCGRLRGRIAPPCSKSYAQRALALSLLAEGTSVLRNIEFCDDTLSAMRCIEALGAHAERIDETTLSVTGGFAPRGNTLYVGESGLATRLFTPVASLWHSPLTIEGQGTLLHRPMSMMIEPLRTLGADIRDGGGYLPIEVCGPLRGGEAHIDGSISSQFVTGLLIALPKAGADTTLHVHGAVSTPYIDMTVETVERFGGRILHNSDYSEIFIEGGQSYHPTDYAIEGDWSAAAMLLVAGALAGEVTVENIPPLSKQADTAICRALVRAGVSLISEERSVTAAAREIHPFEFDATDSPDLFPALAALAAAADGTSTIVGTSRLEHKESHRAETLREEYGKLGIDIDIDTDNVMRIHGGPIRPARVESHGDHRIAMSLAVSALRSDGAITIDDADAVAKSYPTFFDDLEQLRER